MSTCVLKPFDEIQQTGETSSAWERTHGANRGPVPQAGEVLGAPAPPREQGGWATVTTCIQQHPGGASQSNKKAEIKGIVILYKENLREPGKQFLELISEFSKAAEYKINIQKSIVTSQQPDK